MSPFPRLPLWISLCAYFLLTAALIARVPLGASPDEAAHWQYVEHLAQTGALPVFRGAIPPAPGYEFHQPPLYYLLCAPLWKFLGAGVGNYACRAVSLGCGLGAIALIWSAARLVFPQNWRIAALAAGLAALSPLHQGVGAGSNNDALGGMICAALFFLMARFTVKGVTRRDVWQVGVMVGLGILAKNTTLVVAFAAFAALWWSSRRPNSALSPFRALGTALGIAFLVGGWWLARNQWLYGDPLALRVFSQAASAATPGFPQFSIDLDFFTYARGLLWMIFLTAWGFFGGPDAAAKATGPLSLSGPRVPQLELAPLMLVCLAAPLCALWGLWKPRWKTALPATRAVFGFWSLGVVLVIAAWAQFAYAHFSGGQARYLHVALLPFCVWGAAGWMGFWGKGRALKIASALFGAALLLLTLLNVLNWKTLV